MSKQDDKSTPGVHRLTAEEMDDIRQKNIAYQYLCHLEEAKKWIEACINEVLPDASDLEEGFCHGTYLAKLSHFFAPEVVPLRKIFDSDLARYHTSGLHFKHTDNINYFLKALKHIGLPSIFYPETTDIYEKKNIPRTVFCLHALSLFLYRLGIAPKIQDLYGKINFSDEVMDAMVKELSKFGCQLPQFGKIGGILANELPIDEAALHAAIIAINDAIQRQEQAELQTTLANPNSHLSDVIPENVEKYLFILSDAQLEKKEIAFNKSREDSYIPDAYDELLTQKEIQGFINHTNMYCGLANVETAVKNSNTEELYRALLSPVLQLKDVRKPLVEKYCLSLRDEIEMQNGNDLENLMDCRLSLSSIGKVLKLVHLVAEEEVLVDRKLQRINQCLEKGSARDTLSALKAIQDQASVILDYGAPLYHEEMKAIRTEKCSDLDLEEVVCGVRCLTAIARINGALESANSDEVWDYLSNSQAHVQNLDKSHLRGYVDCMTRAKLQKIQDDCPLLTHLDLQEFVDHVNHERSRESAEIDAVTTINEALSTFDVASTISALQNPVLNLSCSAMNGSHFYSLLQKWKSSKAEDSNQADASLWLEDILEVNRRVKVNEESASNACSLLHRVNKAAAEKDMQMLGSILRKIDMPQLRIRRDIIEEVCEKLVTEFLSRDPEVASPWIQHALDYGSLVYLNILTGDIAWEIDSTDSPSPKFISIKDIEEAVQHVLQEAALNQQVERSLVRLQAVCRGYLVRKKQKALKESILKIQGWWRMQLVRRNYVMYKAALRLMEPQIIMIQRLVRKWLHRRRIKHLTVDLQEKVDKVVMIQRAWRKHKARQDLQALTHCDNPPLSVIKKFIHLLEVSSLDFEQELKLQHVKSDVVKSIRRSQELEAQIDELDVKIGLLVHNRITLQDIITVDKENVNPNSSSAHHTKKSKKNLRESEKICTMQNQRGLKALKKNSREKLLRYQHLFYLLQTQPHYLASLIFAIPPGKTTKFIENVIFALYNYGANDRDNYLLLKLFKTALEEEIRCKVLRLSDIVTGNPLVVKMIVSFNRKGAGQASLRDMLGPLVEKVVSDKSIQINTNPVEIYKTWVNQLEMQTGQPSGLPYVVNQEQALQYPEVQTRLLRAVSSLREATLAFCNHITTSRHLIPYAMQYMAKVLRGALHKRFPHIPDKEILKVVGNLVYYRFINSAIIAPDAFDIITVSPDSKLTNDRRLNLASIAKILQFAASKKGFGEEASHLMCLNPLIIECHEKFKSFFRECCEVDDPEIVYDISQYSEAALIIKPTIHITLQEIVETHRLLLDHMNLLAPDPNDPLHKILDDLGERPTLLSVFGDVEHEHIGSSEASLARTDICLALSNKFDLLEGVDPKKDSKDSQLKLFVKTKQLLIDILQCIDGDSVHNLASGPTLPVQESKYKAIVNKRSQQEQRAKLNDTGLNRSNSFLGEARVSLHEVKTKLSHNLRRLENQGLASRFDNYQSLLNAIAKDIVNQRYHRVSRRMELHKLLVAYRKLDEKESFYMEQLQSYKTYLDTCLSKITARNKNVHHACASKSGEKSKNKTAVKYTASKLHEKGIILKIEDLPVHQLKNVLFEISPLAVTGVFQVQVKLMGVGMETLQIDIQDLLQLQYEGVGVKKMMGRVLVNVNLLLHLLNTKFYSKKK